MDRRTFFFLIIMLLFLSLPSDNISPSSDREKELSTRLRNHLLTTFEISFNSTYDTGYGNMTGFELSYDDLLHDKSPKDWPFHHYNKTNPWKEDQRYSILPNVVSDKVRSFWGKEKVNNESSQSYLLDITGNVEGEFTKMQLKEPLKKYDFQLPQFLKDYFKAINDEMPQGGDKNTGNSVPSRMVGNISKSTGRISASLVSDKDRSTGYDMRWKPVEDLSLAQVYLSVSDYEEAEKHNLYMVGGYYEDIGAIVATTRSMKFAGMGISHLTFSEENFNKSQALLKQLASQQNPDRFYEERIKDLFECEYIFYGQLAKTNYDRDTLREIEKELKYPNGRPLPEDLPFLDMEEFLLYSPNCGIVLNSKPDTKLVGPKKEVLNRRLKHLLIGFLGLICLQLLVLFRQIKVANTPGQLSTISVGSLFMIGFQDSLVVLFFLLISNTTLNDEYLLLTCIGVIAFIMCGIFEVRFMITVLTNQANERETTWWEILRGGMRSNQENNETTATPANDAQTQNDNNATTTENNPTNEFGGNDEARYSNNIFAGGFPITIIATFIIMNSYFWRFKYRRTFEFVGLIVTNSYWIPQFLRNTLKNRRKGLTWEFIIGTSLVRYTPVFYLCMVPNNPLKHHKDPTLALSLFSWLLLQIFFLVLQTFLGPRFWVDEHWLPKAYDYQPVISINDLESGFTSDILSNIDTNQDSSKVMMSHIDCAICMNKIDIPVVANNENKKKVTKKDYMVTPCRHIFHEECLSDWMKYKLQCPVCRNGLPPV